MSFMEDQMEVEQSEVKQQEVHQQNRFLHSKRMIIVDEKCQAIVPDKPEKTFEQFIKHKRSLIFQTEKIQNLANIDDYLLFAQSLVLNQTDELNQEDPKKKSKGFSGDGLVLSGLSITQEQVNERALTFLKTMEYNIIKAKFYLLFPSLLVYNQYKHRHALKFTDDYMNEKIEIYISKLNEDKMMQQNKWKQDLMELINSKQKVHLTQLQSLLEQGQQLKYEVPESIKQIHQSSIQIQKQLNKLLKEKQPLEKLRLSLEKYEDQMPIITPEIQQLREQVQKSEQFYSKLQKLPISLEDNQNFEQQFDKLITYPHHEKIQLRTLANYNQEYKQLPIEIKAFELLHKRLYEFVLEIVEKVSKFTKIQQTKTRLGQYISQGEKTEKIALQQAEQYYVQIRNLVVSCDDFDNFNELYLQALELNEKAKQQIDDPDTQQRLLGEVLDCPFYLDVQERLQSMIDYSQILESIKQKMNEREHQIASHQIMALLNRGIVNEELRQLQHQTEQVLEWNQLADEIINYHQNVTHVDVYHESFELQQYPSTLFHPQPEIMQQLEPEKVQEITKIGERVQVWKEQLIQLIDCKQVQPTRKTNQNKSFNKLWELFKEGLRYKQELTLMNKVRYQIIEILDFYAQLFLIKQTLKIADDSVQQIEGIDIICKQFIQKNGQPTSDQIEKLQKFQSPFVGASKDLQLIQVLSQHIEKWQKDATEAIQTQNQEMIKVLLEDAQQLTVDQNLVKELQIQHASNIKVNWIQQTINTKDPLFDSIIQALENDETIVKLKEEMQQIYALNPQNKKKKEGLKLSKMAQNFYLNYQNTLNSYLNQLANLDENKLKKLQPIKVQKLKEYQKEVQNNEDFVRQIEDWIQLFLQWQDQILNLNDQQQQKKKKKVKDSESQSDIFCLTGQLLYYFKVPEMLCLVLQGIEKNFISQELISSIEKLVAINKQAQIALQVQSVRDVPYYSDVFMPQFYVMAKKFRVINNWVQVAQDIITDIPRSKNIIMIKKLKPFLEYLNQLQPQEFKVQKPPQIQPTPSPQPPSQVAPPPKCQSNIKKKELKSINKFKIKSQEESQPTYDQESQSLKHSKRVKKVSKLMKDESIAFYDPNVPIGKGFRSSPNEQGASDPVMQAIKKPIAKRNYKKNFNRKLMPNLEIESQSFLEYSKNSSQELLKLYSSDEIYCTCRQGGESAITDIQIIKSLDEKNVEQFFNHHTKLQQQIKYMIQCDNCEEWYHYECMGIKKQKEFSIEKYICRICLKKNNVPFLILNENIWEDFLSPETELYEEYQKLKIQFEKNTLPNSGEYIYSLIQLPSLEDFKEFVEIGQKLPAYPVELELMELLQQRIFDWLKQYENCKNLSLQQLITLFAESEWLPVSLPQSKNLLIQISQKEFLNTANELLQSKATFKTKSLKKPQQEKTEQLYQFIRETKPELLQDVDHLIIKTIQQLRIQSELNNQLTIQLRQSFSSLEQYEQLANQFEKEVKNQIQQTDIKFSLPKLNELRQQITKIQQWNAEIVVIFKDIDNNFTQNLSQQFYDGKPNLQDVQFKLKEYETITIKVPNPHLEFVKGLLKKADDLISMIDSVPQLSIEEQFQLCTEAYSLKCRIPTQTFKDLMNNVHKDVQVRMLQWLPYNKTGF